MNPTEQFILGAITASALCAGVVALVIYERRTDIMNDAPHTPMIPDPSPQGSKARLGRATLPDGTVMGALIVDSADGSISNTILLRPEACTELGAALVQLGRELQTGIVLPSGGWRPEVKK